MIPRSTAVPLRPAALAFRLIALTLALTGVIRVSGLSSGAPTWNSFLFYTVQSNVLCIIWLILLVVRTVTDLRRGGASGVSTPSARGSGAVMMAITVTMVIYLVVLLPASFQQPGGGFEPFTLTDTLVHVVTPCLLILDWVLFVPKGSFRWFDPPLWALIPLAYLVFALVYGGAGGEFIAGQTYPYHFLDVATLGVGGVVVWVIVLTVAMELVGYLYVAVDRLWGRVRSESSGQ